MSTQANVYTSVNAQTWFTDKCLISTANTSVTFNVALAPEFTGNIYSAATGVAPFSTRYVYVGVGNRLTITGASFTATESGTATSGTAAS